MHQRLRVPEDRIARFEWPGHSRPFTHVFEEEQIDAVEAALAAGRPLLVRGEPGAGKSQLARAAAWSLGRVFVSTIVDAQTECRDLYFELDAVRRLAQAQVTRTSATGLEQDLAEKHFIRPGPLWWAFDWQRAKDHAFEHLKEDAPEQPDQVRPENGVVLLVDEIDKADPSVPNGLLGAFSDGSFDVPGIGRVERKRGVPAPLVLITTNEERALPRAFLRRCVVLTLELEDAGLVDWLVLRGQAHFPAMSDEVLREAAKQLAKDRGEERKHTRYGAGLAEYVDLLWALEERVKAQSDRKSREAEQLAWLAKIATFFFKKEPEDLVS